MKVLAAMNRDSMLDVATLNWLRNHITAMQSFVIGIWYIWRDVTMTSQHWWYHLYIM